MLELIRKCIISKRTKVSVKKKLLKKSNYSNDELSYSIKSFGNKNKYKISNPLDAIKNEINDKKMIKNLDSLK